MLSRKKIASIGALAMVAFAFAGFVGATALVPTSDLPAPSQLAYEPDAAGVSVVIATPDPSASMPWGVRTYRSMTGLTCFNDGRLQGRVEGGEFGQVDPDDGEFHPERLSEARFGQVDPDTGKFYDLPSGATGGCTDLDKAPSSITVSTYPAQGLRGARAVVFGVLSRNVAAVRLEVDNEQRRLDFNAESYIGVITPDEVASATLAFTMIDGTTSRVKLGAEPPPRYQPLPD